MATDSMNPNRKCGEETGLRNLQSAKTAALSSRAEAAYQSSMLDEASFRAELKAAGIVAACRSAAVTCPLASCAILAKQKTWIDSVDRILAKTLEAVGGDKVEVL